MFRRKLLRVALLLIACTALMLLLIVRVGNRDRSEYEKLLRSANPEAFLDQMGPEVGRQSRQNVEKNLWFSKEVGRLHLRLNSKESELRFTTIDQKTEVVEDLKELRCFMQEELYYLTERGDKASLQENGRILVKGEDPTNPSAWYDPEDPRLIPMQQVRYLEAESGTQNYTENLFTADKVTLSRFTTKGHELPDTLQGGTLMMKGIASAVEFSLGGEDINFRAYHLRATFYSEGDLL